MAFDRRMTNAAAGRRRALVLTSDGEPADQLLDELNGAGYAVVRCHEDASPAFPCKGLGSDACPLDEPGGVDVAIDVRQHPWPNPTPRELGVTCALSSGTPLVVMGATSDHPFRRWASDVAETADVAAACELAIEQSLEPLRAAAAKAVETVMATHGASGTVEVDADRRLCWLHLRISADLDGSIRGVAATRAGVAVRHLDQSANKIEISFV